tara:strand:- start:44 stop:541 length:498 start_codon:yes stop_codon:yes gene_type:complete
MITQDRLKELLSYDKTSGNFTWTTSRSGQPKVGSVAGCIIQHGYIAIRIDGTNYRAHRLAFLYVVGELPPEEVDHINGVRTDNTWNNLRAVSRQENGLNQKRSSANTSGVPGVCFKKNLQKWRAQAHYKGRYIEFGLFVDWFDAVCARKSAENTLGFHKNHGRTA